MSSYVRFTKDGLFEFKWDSETQSYPSTRIAETGIFATLRMTCRIDPDVTLRDIFETVESYPSLMAFIAQYSWCFAIRDFHAAARAPRPAGGKGSLTHLEINRYVETNTYEGYKLTPDITEALNFSGVGVTNQLGHEHYGVSLSPMNEIAHLPVRLNPQCELRHNLVEKRGEWETTFTLLEVLDAIYDDISFHGGPEESQAFAAELTARVEDVKAGRVNIVPFESLLKKETVN